MSELKTSEHILLLDGNSLINRAFFGLSGRSNLTAPDGTPTGALFAFMNMLLRYRDEVRPTHICAAFDRKEPTFRHIWYEGYKATRKPMPDDLAVQVPLLKELLDEMGVSRLEMPGYEADDLIGTLAHQGLQAGMQVTIVTGDKDSFQLAEPGVTILQPVTRSGKTETERYDAAAITDRYRIRPDQFVDLKAIMGDPSDNIPGVKGIGEKGAMDLVSRYGSLDGIYANLAEIRPNLAEKLRQNQEMAYLSQRLSRIDREVPLTCRLDDLIVRPARTDKLKETLIRLDFRSLLNRLNLDAAAPTITGPSENVVKLTVAQFQQQLEQWTVKPADQVQAACFITPDGTLCWSGLPGSEGIYCLRPADREAAWAVLAASPVRVAFYDYKRLLHTWSLAPLPGAIHDVLIAAYLLNQLEGKSSLERIYQRVTGETWPLPASDTSQTSPGQLPFAGSGTNPGPSDPGPAAGEQLALASLMPDRLPAEAADSLSVTTGKHKMSARTGFTPVQPGENSQAAAVKALFRIASLQAQVIHSRDLGQLVYAIEMPLSGILAAMERVGFALDLAKLDALADEMQQRINDLQNQIFAGCGEIFNLNSPKQLGQVLYEHLGLAKGKKNSGGAYSTNSEELERLSGEHPVIPLIIEHRLTAKLRSTFVEGLRKVADPVDGRVHTTFNQVLTATGRLSSSEPNLQNIPIRSESGARIREAFIAAPGWVLLDADYSQIELRLLAHLAEDPVMVEAFNRGEDIHLNTARHIFDLPAQLITPAMRSAAKTVNFSIVYGISDFGLARDLGITVKEAHRYITGYNEEYPKVRAYLESLVSGAYANGYVETLFGRRRYLPELQSPNRNLRSFGERAAMNTPIQGTAADLIKIAMVRVAQALADAGLKARLVLQVHDELIVEAPRHEAAQAGAILKQAMEGALNLSVPLIADVHQGQRWSDCK